MEAGLERLEFVSEVGEVAVENGQLPAGIGCRFGRAVVTGAGDEFEELVDVAVQLQDCIAVAARGDQTRDGEGFGGQVGLDGVGEGDAVEVVLAAGAALQEEFALLGYDYHFRREAVAAGQGLYTMNDADVVMAEDSYQLLGRKMCAASRHKLMISYSIPSFCGDDNILDYLSRRSRRMTRKNAAVTALKTNTAIR